jgi:hypothetical protein
MAHGAGSSFDNDLPFAKRCHVAALNWGLVAEKTKRNRISIGDSRRSRELTTSSGLIAGTEDASKRGRRFIQGALLSDLMLPGVLIGCIVDESRMIRRSLSVVGVIACGILIQLVDLDIGLGKALPSGPT